MPPHPRLYDKIKSGEVQLPLVPKQFETSAARPEGTNALAALSGSIRALAVLVDFSDNTSSVQAEFFDKPDLCPARCGRGSVRDYFSEVSYGQVDIVTLHLPSALGWQRAPQTYSDYVNDSYCIDGVYPNNCQKLAEDVVDADQARWWTSRSMTTTTTAIWSRS